MTFLKGIATFPDVIVTFSPVIVIFRNPAEISTDSLPLSYQLLEKT